jgi:hypothetical protein
MAWRLSSAVVTFERRRRSCQWVVTAATGATQIRRFLVNVPVQEGGGGTLLSPSSAQTAAFVATAAVVAAGVTCSASCWWWYGQDSNHHFEDTLSQHKKRMGAVVVSTTTNCEELLPNFGSSSDPISWHVPREGNEDGEPSLVLRPLERKTCRWIDGVSPAEQQQDHPDSKSIRAYATSATQFLDRMIEPYNDSETTVSSSDPYAVSPKSVLLATTEAQQLLQHTTAAQQAGDNPSSIVHALLDHLHHHDDKSNTVTTRKMYFFHSPEIESWRAEKVRLSTRAFSRSHWTANTVDPLSN